MIRAFSDGDNMSYEVLDTGNGFLIVSKVRDSMGVRSIECTKRQWDNEFLEKLADGLNKEPTSASYQISLSVLSKYEFALYWRLHRIRDLRPAAVEQSMI